MIQKPSDCQECSLFKGDPSLSLPAKQLGFIPPDGTGANLVQIAGEAGGEQEEREGKPFVEYAEAGSVLKSAFARLGLSRSSFSILNAVNCRPPRNWLDGAPWEQDAINHCRAHRDRGFNKYLPKVILALGAVPFRTYTGLSGHHLGITRVRGYPVPAATYRRPDGSPVPVIGSIHPSHIKRGETKFLSVLYHDIMRALEIARTGWDWTAAMEVEYRSAEASEQPAPWAEESQCLPLAREQVREFIALARSRPDLWLTYDLETSLSADVAEDELDPANAGDVIKQVQFSLQPKTAIIMPWENPWIDLIEEILALPNEKMGCNNWEFDDPLLLKAGMRLGGQYPHDLRWLWHALQPDLPADLQFICSFYGMSFIWKHLCGTALDWYGGADVDGPQRCLARILDDLRARGCISSYMDQVYKLSSIYKAATRRGIPVNDQKRKVLEEKLIAQRQEIFLEIQTIVPQKLLGVHPAEGYKRVPKEIAEALVGYSGPAESLEGQVAYIRNSLPAPIVVGRDLEEDGAKAMGMWDLRQFPAKSKGTLEELGQPEVLEPRWCIVKPFLPGATKQLMAYMRYRKHPVPKKRKEDKETTEQKELERMYKKYKDPLYGKTLEYRGVDKMIGTYVQGWAPAADGRVHGTFHFGPATGQTGSKNPNVQNAPKHKDIAKAFRQMIEAPQGYTLVEIDYSSAHAVTTGFEAQDPVYLHMARLDMHSFLGSYLANEKYIPREICKVSPTLSDGDLKQIFKLFKSCSWSSPDGECRHTEQEKKDGKCSNFIRDKWAKPAILGYGFGLGVHHFWEDNQESITLKIAKWIYKILDEVFPTAKKWRDDVRLKAHKDTFLLSLYGYIRWFFDVYHWDPKKCSMVAGKDSERAIAFLPANDAFGLKRAAMIRLEEQGWLERGEYINDLHDALKFCCPDGLVADLVSAATLEMTRPSERLKNPLAPEGLVIGVETKVGRNWQEMVKA